MICIRPASRHQPSLSPTPTRPQGDGSAGRPRGVSLPSPGPVGPAGPLPPALVQWDTRWPSAGPMAPGPDRCRSVQRRGRSASPPDPPSPWTPDAERCDATAHPRPLPSAGARGEGGAGGMSGGRGAWTHPRLPRLRAPGGACGGLRLSVYTAGYARADAARRSGPGAGCGGTGQTCAGDEAQICGTRRTGRGRFEAMRRHNADAHPQQWPGRDGSGPAPLRHTVPGMCWKRGGIRLFRSWTLVRLRGSGG